MNHEPRLVHQGTGWDSLPLLTVLLLAGSLVGWALFDREPRALHAAAAPEFPVAPAGASVVSAAQVELLDCWARRTPLRTPAADEPDDGDLGKGASAPEDGGCDSLLEALEGLDPGRLFERELSVAGGQLAGGRPDGPWAFLGPDGAPLVDAAFRAGEPDGDWRVWHAEGGLAAAGAFDSGRLDGTWREWYPDGTPRLEVTYVDGLREGPYTEWWPDGHKRVEGAYRADLRHSLWRAWFADGGLRYEGVYRDGLREGRWRRWHQGQAPLLDADYRQGRPHGAWRSWYAHGQPREAGQFVHGLREGPWSFWNPDGSLERRSGLYVGGKWVGQ